MKKLLLFPFFLCCSLLLHAQLWIAQDVSHCAFGLKNDSSEWVVKPAYASIRSTATSTEMTTLKGWIVSADGTHYGVLDSLGNVIFPATFDSIGYFEAFPVTNIFIHEHNVKKGPRNSLLIPIYPTVLDSAKDCIIFCYSYYRQGMADKKGNVISKKLYSQVGRFEYGHALIVEHGETGIYRYGYIDRNGNETVPAVYENISQPTHYGVYVLEKEKTFFVRWSDEKISSVDMQFVQNIYNDSMFIGKKGNQYGLLSADGKIFAPAVYDDILPGCQGGIYYVKKNGKYGLLKASGKFLLKPDCDSILRPCVDDYFDRYKYDKTSFFLFKRKGKWGIAKREKVVVTPQYTLAGWYDAYKSTFWVLNKDHVETFDASGTELKRIPVSKAMQADKGKVTLVSDYHTVITDTSGKLLLPVFPFELQGIINTNSGIVFSVAKGKNGTGVFSWNDSALVIPTQYVNAGVFGNFFMHRYDVTPIDDGFLYVETSGGHYGIFTQYGKKITDTVFTTLSEFDEENSCWYALDENKKWMVLDTTGEILAGSGEQPIRTTDRRLIISENGKHEIFDVERRKIEAAFREISALPQGIFLAKNDSGMTGVIDGDGNIILPLTYDNVFKTAGDYLEVYKDGSSGIIDLNGNFILPLSKEDLALRDIALDSLYNLSHEHEDDSEYGISLADTGGTMKMRRIANNYLIVNYAVQPESDDDYQSDLPLIVIGEDNVDYSGDWYYEEDYGVAGVSKKLFTISYYTSSSGHGTFTEDISMNSYVVRHDSIIEVKLFDILRADTTCESLNDSIRAQIADSAGDDFFFDCSNPEMLSPDYFTVSNEGIYFSYYSRNDADDETMLGEDLESRTQTALLTWKTLKPFLKDKSLR